MSTRVTTAEGESLGYLASVPDLDGRRFEIQDAIETTVGTVYGDRENGYLYHASNREPLITRWKLEPDGSFTPAGRLSFANLGYGAVGAAAAAPFYSSDKAYFVQDTELVIWNPEAMEIDEGYELDLTTLTEGRQAGDFAIIDDQTAVLRVWHPELVSELNEDESNWEEILGENGHLWWRWTLGEPQATPIADQAPGAYGGEWYDVDGSRLLLQAEGDFSESTLLRLEGEALAPALSGPGYIWGLTRMR